MADLKSDIRYLKGVGERRAQLLQRLGISSVDALLRHYPHRYEDWSDPVDIFSDNLGKTVCIKATVTQPAKEHFIRKNMVIYSLIAADNSGPIKITFFNSKYTAQSLIAGNTYLFFGKLEGTPFIREMTSPAVDNKTFQGLRPVYHTTKGINSKTISSIAAQALKLQDDSDPIPEFLRSRENLIGKKEALRFIHSPESKNQIALARKRLIFEELFLLQAGMIAMKTRNKQDTSVRINPEYCDQFFDSLPFSPTGAQKRAVLDCLNDMQSGKVMNRLIQGDVGSGKTLVSAAVIFCAAKSGLQSALMAPTEILAEQHYETLKGFLEPFEIKCTLLTGSLTKRRREDIKQQLSSGQALVAIGTQALFSEDISFANLALVITDEQHRFGVLQRAALSAKGDRPHTLVMSATPIPRTLAMTIYGDLDVSIIDEYPKGRQPIETYAVGPDLHERIYNYIEKHLNEGRQAYIICPLVEPSDTEEEEEPTNEAGQPICAETCFTELSTGRFKNWRVGLLHGKMNAKDKNDAMQKFQNKEIDLLIATTVVEVGIDVPNAAIMVIENAERFGLSQLHQLRGRIGRGPFKSTCILVSHINGKETSKRLNVLCRTRDGFEIADEDLKLRGPGDFLGQRQHGLPELKIADLASDLEILRRSGKAAQEILKGDPQLELSQHAALKNEIEALFRSVGDI